MVREDLATFDALSFLSKRPVRAQWRPIEVEVTWSDPPGQREHWHRADFPTPNFGCLVLGERAKAALEKFIEPYGELLPLSCPDEPFWALNVTKVVDALDLRSSEILDRETMDPDAPNVVRHAFLADRIRGLALFRVRQSNVSNTFFTDLFLAEIERHGLTGFGWRREWDSERRPAGR